MTALRVGVIGAGVIGRTHLNAYRAAGTAAVAVTDVDPTTAESVATEFGITAYPTAAAMLTDAGLDAVSVCTPPAGHLEVARQALQAGVAVLCEKPMARTVEECDAMISAAEERGALLTVGFCHRFQPEVEAMRSMIRSGRVGKVLSFRNRFSGPLDGVETRWFSQPDIAGGGVLMDSSIHSVDLFRYLIGEIDHVVAITATAATDRGPALSVEDTAVLAVRSIDGVIGVIEASWRTAPGEAVISVSGTQGRLELDYATASLTLIGPDGNSSVMEVASGDRFVRQARQFLDCVAGGAQPRVTARDGARAVAVLAEAYTSAGSITATPRKAE